MSSSKNIFASPRWIFQIASSCRSSYSYIIGANLNWLIDYFEEDRYDIIVYNTGISVSPSFGQSVSQSSLIIVGSTWAHRLTIRHLLTNLRQKTFMIRKKSIFGQNWLVLNWLQMYTLLTFTILSWTCLNIPWSVVDLTQVKRLLNFIRRHCQFQILLISEDKDGHAC